MNNFIKSYEEIFLELDNYTKKTELKDIFRYETSLGTTTFLYDIPVYTLGNGTNHLVIMSGTHGCELYPIYFLMEFIRNILNNKTKYIDKLNTYTFHIIVIHNPEGYVISSSNILRNISKITEQEFKLLCNRYLKAYNMDDKNAKQFPFVCRKLYKNVIKCSTNNIINLSMKNKVIKIIKNCCLDERILIIWSSNGMGIDPNANSIHQFENMKRKKNKQKFGILRYNDITITRPSPHNYYGSCPFDKNCPENILLYKYITNMYNNMNIKKMDNNRFIAFFSYHSTGREIYYCPDEKFADDKQISFHQKFAKLYSNKTGYELINEKTKYSVMDYYRIALRSVLTLTIELGKNANPIGPFSEANEKIQKEIKDNISAIFYTLDNIVFKK